MAGQCLRNYLLEIYQVLIKNLKMSITYKKYDKGGDKG